MDDSIQFLDFIDLSENIIEYRSNLNLNKNQAIIYVDKIVINAYENLSQFLKKLENRKNDTQ